MNLKERKSGLWEGLEGGEWKEKWCNHIIRPKITDVDRGERDLTIVVVSSTVQQCKIKFRIISYTIFNSLAGTYELSLQKLYWAKHSEVEAGGSLRVQGQPSLHRKFQVSQGRRPLLKNRGTKKLWEVLRVCFVLTIVMISWVQIHQVT